MRTGIAMGFFYIDLGVAIGTGYRSRLTPINIAAVFAHGLRL